MTSEAPALFEREKVDLLGPDAVGPLTHPDLGSAQVWLVRMTPELAANYKLLNSDAQRNKSVDTSATYAADMDSNEWVFIGDPIRVDVEGRVIDGQHRVEAVIKSGKTQWMTVVTGLPEGVMRYVDMGRKRTYADTLRIRGVKQNIPTASLIRSIYYWKQGHYIMPNVPRLPNLNTVVRPSNAALDLIYDEMTRSGHDPLASVQTARRVQDAITSTVPAKAISAAAHLFSLVDVFHAQEFFDRLTDSIEGDDRITRSSFPPNLLRARMSRSIQGSGEFLPPQEWLHLFIQAWNLWRNGQERETLKRPMKPISAGSWAFPDGLGEAV